MPIWIIIVLAVSSVINILVPLSGSAAVTPILAQHYSLQDAVAIASSLFALNALFRVWLFRKTIRMDMVKPILLYSVVGAAVGAYVVGLLNQKLLTLVVICLLIRFTYISIKRYMTKDAKSKPYKSSQAGANILGFVSGGIQGGGVTGGVDLRNGYLISKGLNLIELSGTTAVVGAANFTVATVIRLVSGTTTFSTLRSGLVLLPVVMIGTIIGKKLLYRLKKEHQQILAICALFLSLVLIIRLLL